MNKTEFLEILRTQLLSDMPPIQAASHVEYYENYINQQVEAGKPEDVVLEELGDPRLIAKTILDTNSYEPNGGSSSYGSGSYNSREDYYDTQSHSEKSPIRRRVFASLDLSTWQGKLLAIGATVVILVLLITILSALIPVAVVIFVILFLISQFRKRR